MPLVFSIIFLSASDTFSPKATSNCSTYEFVGTFFDQSYIFIILGPYVFADILDFKNLQEKIVTNRIDTVIHFSALLSAIGEQNTPLAMRVNIEGLHNILEVCRQYRIKLFVPSTIGEQVEFYNLRHFYGLVVNYELITVEAMEVICRLKRGCGIRL